MTRFSPQDSISQKSLKLQLSSGHDMFLMSIWKDTQDWITIAKNQPIGIIYYFSGLRFKRKAWNEGTEGKKTRFERSTRVGWLPEKRERERERGGFAYTSSVLVVLMAFPSVRHELIGPDWRARCHTHDRVTPHDFFATCSRFLRPEREEWRIFPSVGSGLTRLSPL